MGHHVEGGGWVFEIVVDDKEVGVVVLSAALDVVEIEITAPDEDADLDSDESTMLERIVPRPEGAAFLWATLAAVLFVFWPRSGWAGRLLAVAIVVWGVAWFLFWSFVDVAQAVLWFTALTVMASISLAILNRDLQRFPGRGDLRPMRVGLLMVLAWLAWLAMSGPFVEDSTIGGAKGGRYLVDHLQFPYGVLGEGATYGPVQYLIHAPLTMIWLPGEIGVDPFTAARVVAVAATLALGLGVVMALGRRTPSAASGALAVLLLPWFVSVVDVANVSQLVPIAFTVWAFVMASRRDSRSAVFGGVLLGLGAGAMFVPALAAPALLITAWERWRSALAGMIATGIAILVMLLSTGTDMAAFWNDTIRFQETAYAAEGGLSMWGRLGIEDWRWVGKALHVLLAGLSLLAFVRYRSRPAAFLAANGRKPENLAASATRMFLGIRLECAQCHDHPFSAWEQEDFWSFAAFFGALFYARTIAMPWLGDLNNKLLWPDFNALWPNAGPAGTVAPFTTMGPWPIPTINTALLLTSGVTLTWAHHALREGKRAQVIQGMLLTIILGAVRSEEHTSELQSH